MKLQSAILTILMALLFTACQQKGYKIDGTAQGLANGDTIYLTTDLQYLTPTDSIIVKDGHFKYSAETDTVQLAMLYSANLKATAIFFTEPGTISITLSTDPFQTNISGTKANEGWQKLSEISNDYGQRVQAKAEMLYNDSITPEAHQAVLEELQKLEDELQQKFLEQIEQNIDNELGYFIVSNYASGDKMITNEKCKELIGRMPEKFRQRQAIKDLEDYLAKVETTSTGKVIADFSLPTPDGTNLSVMSVVKQNKVTILDFWASWCSPCIREMPFMKELYAKYHANGLGIVGISLDDNKEAWVKAIKELGITWPQMSDLKGWKSEPGQMFSVNSIPFMVIVDQEGTILEKGLRGEELSEFISKTLD